MSDGWRNVGYTSAGKSNVLLKQDFDFYEPLGLSPETASIGSVRSAFRERITSPDRQVRASVSLAASAALHRLHVHSLNGVFAPGTTASRCRFDGGNPWVLALLGSRAGLNEYLRRCPDQVDATNGLGETFLYLAARSGYVDVVELLVKMRANVQGEQKDRSTVLHAASYYGHAMLVTTLMRLGCPTEHRNRYQLTACEEGASEEIREMLRRGGGENIARLARECVDIAESTLRYGSHRSDGAPYTKAIAHRLELRDVQGRLSELGKWNHGWHGTKFASLASILRNGLHRPGTTVGKSSVSVRDKRIALGATIDGVKDWGRATFVSPSVMYSAHGAYAEVVVDGGDEWYCLVEVAVRPGSFTRHASTVGSRAAKPAESGDVEWRVEPAFGVSEADAARVPADILRVPEGSNTVVLGAVFVQKAWLQHTDFPLDDVDDCIGTKFPR